MAFTYRVIIHHKSFWGNTTVFNIIDKVTKGDFYAYEDGCFKLYCAENGKRHTYIFPLDKIDNIEIIGGKEDV